MPEAADGNEAVATSKSGREESASRSPKQTGAQQCLQQPNLRQVADGEASGKRRGILPRASVNLSQRTGGKIHHPNEPGQPLVGVRFRERQFARRARQVAASEFLATGVVRALGGIPGFLGVTCLRRLMRVMMARAADMDVAGDFRSRSGRGFVPMLRVRVMPTASQHGMHS